MLTAAAVTELLQYMWTQQTVDPTSTATFTTALSLALSSSTNGSQLCKTVRT